MVAGTDAKQRLIDANELIELLASMQSVCRTHAELVGISKVWQQVKHMPTVDAVPVIRCKDCKFLRLTGTAWKCQNRLVMMLCESNDYCSRAERKEE